MEDEDLLALVLLADLVRVLEEVGNEGVLADDEAVFEFEAVCDHLDLVEGFLAGVVEADVAALGDGVGELEEHGGFACAWGTCEHHDAGGDEAFAAEGVVEELEACLLAGPQGVGDGEFVDVGAALEVLDADAEVHGTRHVVLAFR